jgi:hypothetical protein
MMRVQSHRDKRSTANQISCSGEYDICGLDLGNDHLGNLIGFLLIDLQAWVRRPDHKLAVSFSHQPTTRCP